MTDDAHRPIPPRYSANLSLLYSEHAPLDRPAAAAADGFTRAESWWHFDSPAPSALQIAEFCDAFSSTGVALTLLNLTHGPDPKTDRGVLTGLVDDAVFDQHISALTEILQRTGCRLVHALVGNRLDPAQAAAEDARVAERLARLADRIAPLGATAVVETLSPAANPRYPLTAISRTAALVERARDLSGERNIGILLDVFHLAEIGDDPAQRIRDYGTLIGHIQFADSPGRGRPGTGAIDFDAVHKSIADIGYTGLIGLEYLPGHERPAIPSAD